MYQKRTVLEVQDWGDRWQVLYIVEDVPETPEETVWATQAGHCFPKDTLEWRAAEYGIDPADTDALLDIVLAEPFLMPGDFTPGESLHDAPDIEAARRAHLRRCAQGKLRARLSTRAGKSARSLSSGPAALSVIKENSPMEEVVLREKRRFVAEQRQQYRDNVERERTRARQSRAERIREELRGNRG